MALWVALALMTAAAIGAVLWPLRRRTDATPETDTNDVAVYRDQLDEITRDQRLGLIAGPEAQAARIEVSRRLLAADERKTTRHDGSSAGAPAHRRRFAAAAALVALPIGAIAFYLTTGSPGLPGQPFDARAAAAHPDSSFEALFARVESHLEQHPEDGRGWEVIAPIYMRIGRYDEAVKARSNALRLLGTSAERLSYYGEALTAQSNGIVTAEAKAAFDRAIELDGRDPTARFYEGLAAEQDGSREEAARIWRALLADAPPTAPWLRYVRDALGRLDGTAASAGQPPPASAPGQDAMIRGMVERLAARLREDGSDADGWVRLLRSYKVLGEREKMEATVADARRALANDAQKLAQFEDGAKAIESEPADAPAPSSSIAAAPPDMSAADEDEMVRGMVERLAARLRQDSSNVDGWIMLVRSYSVLGDRKRAQEAAAAARAALATNADGLRRLEDGFKSFGFEG